MRYPVTVCFQTNLVAVAGEPRAWKVDQEFQTKVLAQSRAYFLGPARPEVQVRTGLGYAFCTKLSLQSEQHSI